MGTVYYTITATADHFPPDREVSGVTHGPESDGRQARVTEERRGQHWVEVQRDHLSPRPVRRERRVSLPPYGSFRE